MVYQMVQEGALWPDVIDKIWATPVQRKITWASVVNAVVDVGIKGHKNVT